MSNSSFPWFPFYARDWLTDVMVRAMPISVRGAYIELLALQWENGGLPKDPEQVRQLLGIHAESFPSWWDQLERHFPVVDDDSWLTERRNPRLEKLRDEKLAKRAAQSAGARSSHAKRHANQCGKQGGKQSVRASDDLDSDSDAHPEKTSVRKRPGAGYPVEFEAFWNVYPKRNEKRVGKKATYRRWRVLLPHRIELLTATGHYAQSKTARVDGKARDPERFLKDDYWRDWLDGPGTDEHVDERDRPRPAPQAPQGGPPADPDDVAAELGLGSLREATRALSMEERLKKEEGK